MSAGRRREENNHRLGMCKIVTSLDTVNGHVDGLPSSALLTLSGMELKIPLGNFKLVFE